MKNSIILRMLSVLGFLLLFAPFYDSCNRQETVQEKTEKKQENIVNTKPLTGFDIAQMSILVYQEGNFQELKEEFHKEGWYKQLGLIVSIFFDFIALVSISITILSFFNKNKIINKLALANTILVITTLLYIIFLESSFEHFRQIKWGYYAFLIINILIFYFSKSVFAKEKMKF